MLAAINKISVDIIMPCGIGVSIAASVTVWNTNLNTIWYYGNTKDSIDWFRYASTHSIFGCREYRNRENINTNIYINIKKKLHYDFSESISR